jgi:hypothetical protein
VHHEGKYVPRSKVMFLRTAEKEMRELAKAPEMARELGTIADQFRAEADDLVRHIAE